MKQIGADFNADPHHREYSRDHAHHHWKEFAGNRSKDNDLAALHLAFYLASFGMYRGKSDLLNGDYKALAAAVTFLKEQKEQLQTGLADLPILWRASQGISLPIEGAIERATRSAQATSG